MTVTVQDQVPDWFENPSFQAAGVKFGGVDTNGDERADTFSAGTTVEIVIIASRFNGISQFKHHLAHELTHLIKGDSGNFLRENGVLQRENQTYDRLFTALNPSDYDESMDYAVAMPGNQVNYYGTNGNNQFTDPGSYNQIYTGGGNDIVQSGDYSDLVVMNGSGLKFIIDYGSGWDTLEANTIATMADLVWTRVGLDLYITNRLAGTAPTKDPNAIILLDWYAMLPYGHIDYLKTADGNMIVLVDVAGQGVPAAAPMGSDEASLYLFPGTLEAPEGRTWEFQSSSERYEDVLSYTSYGVDPSSILSAWETMAIDQLIRSRPADTDLLSAWALNDGPGSHVQRSVGVEMPHWNGLMVEPLTLQEAVFV